MVCLVQESIAAVAAACACDINGTPGGSPTFIKLLNTKILVFPPGAVSLICDLDIVVGATLGLVFTRTIEGVDSFDMY